MVSLPPLRAAGPGAAGVAALVLAAVFDLARDAGWPWLPWAGLALLGAGCAVALCRLPSMERYPVG